MTLKDGASEELLQNNTDYKFSMEWKAKAGDTFLKYSGSVSHLFIVLFDPFQHVEKGYGDFLYIASVNITSIHNAKYDLTCILQAGDHPFIKHSSYVNYRMLECELFSVVQKRVESGEYPLQAPISKDLLYRIVAGIFESDNTKNRFLKELKHLNK